MTQDISFKKQEDAEFFDCFFHYMMETMRNIFMRGCRYASVFCIAVFSPISILVPQLMADGLPDFPATIEKADAGDANAAAMASTHYWIGWKTPKDPGRALYYAQASASKGSPLGLFRLGVLIANGVGISPDQAVGIALQSKAFAGLRLMGDDPCAKTALGIIYFQGLVAEKNLSIAVNYYRQAAEAGYAPAQHNYAMCAFYGQGMPKDESIYSRFIASASKQGYPPSVDFLTAEATREGAGSGEETQNPNSQPSGQTAVQTRAPSNAAEQELREMVILACLNSLEKIAGGVPKALGLPPPFEKALCENLGIKEPADASGSAWSDVNVTSWLDDQTKDVLQAAAAVPDSNAFLQNDLECYRSAGRVFSILTAVSESRNTDALREIANVIPSETSAADQRIRTVLISCFAPIGEIAATKVRESDALRSEKKSLVDKDNYEEWLKVFERASALDLRAEDSASISELRESIKKRALDSLGL
ncbi:MAG: sel1 repeat family protein [Chthoniobacterales bacterium]|nr:sel1 repeat family protein [Chthoniobacterales bacterium]